MSNAVRGGHGPGSGRGLVNQSGQAHLLEAAETVEEPGRSRAALWLGLGEHAPDGVEAARSVAVTDSTGWPRPHSGQRYANTKRAHDPSTRHQAPTRQCWTSSSGIGKSEMLAVASAAPTPTAAAAIKQSAWCSVMPLSANSRRQRPARWPSAAPNGAIRSACYQATGQRLLIGPQGRARSPQRTPRTPTVPRRHAASSGDGPLPAVPAARRSVRWSPAAIGTRSARPARIALPLGADPAGSIVVPIVAGVGDRAEQRFDLVPATLVIEAAPDHCRDERAPSPRPRPPVDVLNEMVLQLNVQSHVSIYTH